MPAPLWFLELDVLKQEIVESFFGKKPHVSLSTITLQ